MKVVEHGITYRRIDCPKCRAVLEITDSDFQVGYHNIHNLDDNYYFVVCPECYNRIVGEPKIS